MMKSLDLYDDMPSAMRAYLSHFGFHFNKKAYEFATSKLRKKNASGQLEHIEPYTKEQVSDLLKRYVIKVDNDTLYDLAYLASVCKAKFLKTSIIDEQRLAMYLKDYADCTDGCDDMIFREWLALMVGRGHPVDFEDFM